MKVHQGLDARVVSRPPIVVLVCALSVALVGYLVSIASLLVLAGNSAIEVTGPFLTVDLDDLIWLIYGILYRLVVAGVSTLAAREYWQGRRRALAAHLLAILLLLPLLPIALAGVALVAISLVILATMASYLNSSRALVISAIGAALALATFFYQRMGPYVGQYGTECIPIENCFGPLLGAGYPVQFIINTPGITDPVNLGSEDEFRLLPFALDILVFIIITYLGSIAVLRSRACLKSRERKITGRIDPPGGQTAA